MAAFSRGGRPVLEVLRGSPHICPRCANGTLPSQRLYSAAAAATSALVEPPTEYSPPPPLPGALPSSSAYRIKSGIILTRAPLLTRELTAFETSFFLYQKRLEERLSARFRPATYFQTDTAAELDWRLKLRERRGVAGKDVGRYNPRGRSAWDDEVRVGSDLGDSTLIAERLAADAELRVSEDGEEIPLEDRVRVERPLPRRTEADEKGDQKRLDRALDRTLYLVVKRGPRGGSWMFPTGTVPTYETLHETAARTLTEAAGVNMNTWIVGRVPVAHLVTPPVYAEVDHALQTRGEKTFFLKGRIMAGQADLTGNKLGLADFKWLTKEELQEALPEQYYHGVRRMIADR